MTNHTEYKGILPQCNNVRPGNDSIQRVNETGETGKDTVFVGLYVSLLFLITFVSIVGNILVMVVFSRRRKLLVPINYYLLSLAVGNLLNSLVFTLYQLSHIEGLPFIHVIGVWEACSVVLSVLEALHFCSTYHLVAITVTRYVLITDPLRSNQRLTSGKMAVGTATLWIASFVLSAAIYKGNKPEKYLGVCRYELIFPIGQVLGLMLIVLVLPLVIMLGLYLRIARIARRQAILIAAQEVSGPDDGGNRKQSARRTRKAAILVTFLLGAFVLSWSPFLIYSSVKMACGSCKVNDYIRASVRLLLHMNNATNVFIYAGRLAEFKDFIRDIRRYMWLSIKSRFCR